MNLEYDCRYPSVDDLRKRAKKRMPKFIFDYLDGGCNEDINLERNISDIREKELLPKYLSSNHTKSDISTELFGHVYDAPFGISPVGLQGLMWPNSPEILAKAALKHNIPFILSTVTTSDIERISEITEGKAWFQLYHPKEDKLRDDLLRRAWEAQNKVLVILCDVPVFGYRHRDIKNGLSMPPRLNPRNILQIMGTPRWAMEGLCQGRPSFANMKPYMPKGMGIKNLGFYMDQTFDGKLNRDKISAIRDMWKGKLVLKGVASEEDTAIAVELGLDGIIVSNHGGRQLDAGPSSIKSLDMIVKNYSDKITIMMDSGMRSGPDIARVIASGAKFTFMGRPFMYGVGALGKKGGDHTISILKRQFYQVMEQLCCNKVSDLPDHLM
ncbi:alpha-hydroxy acid oxidase [Ichthyobacterium seriolicida]|uniref:L-lactate dehydrogenase n=1 Tax=Ichthyobacterium seriolicida TaxID=242600 RepID=A0A1J1E4E2_9FLAO|nr:alpha-hydroxy acid oxidase [Ichthyobacterium seriolicida]BAV94916.1 L-lactate dehydrogenase [Ichthyobacterium seriolicida]